MRVLLRRQRHHSRQKPSLPAKKDEDGIISCSWRKKWDKEKKENGGERGKRGEAVVAPQPLSLSLLINNGTREESV